MLKSVASFEEILPHLFRQEYAKMTAVLCRHFGLAHIETAEDIASETFLKASENWAINGIPEKPIAWLYTVASNKAKDHLKRTAIFETKIKHAEGPGGIEAAKQFEFDQQLLADSELAMIFAVCNSNNAAETQICLVLQILCGFSTAEIANAFLTKTETIKKRLYRGRTNLRNDNFKIKTLQPSDIQAGLDTVLKAIYLLFNEGYFSKTADQLIRKDLCSEAIRLASILSQNVLTNVPQVNALLALMCFQGSRLDARADTTGQPVLFNQQDKTRWDNVLIQKGNYYLVNACTGNEVSTYHLEAGIAYWHTVTQADKWPQILKLYDQLVLLAYSPITALNRIFCYAQVYGNEQAIIEAEKLNLYAHNDYHKLLGYLYADSNIANAIDHYRQALVLTKSKAEKQMLNKEIDRLVAQSIANQSS